MLGVGLPEVTLPSLVADLVAEHQALDALVAPLAASQWDLPTPAAGWAVRDQVSHLAFFDEQASVAAIDPGRFATEAEAAMAAVGQGGDPMAEHLARGRAMAGDEVLAWWRRARADMVRSTESLTASSRLPWYGPPMGALSFVSARLMETWAHGQDVADALGVNRRATDRLVHVAHLGVRARPFSYLVRGMTPPTTPVRVALTAPGGTDWTWDEDADAGDDVVSGTALDFCLVVTQRRHLLDTSLVVDGPTARQWMAVAQAFAGPPGPGRPSSRPA